MSSPPKQFSWVLLLGLVAMGCTCLSGIGFYVYRNQLLPRSVTAQSQTPAEQVKRIDATWSRYRFRSIPVTAELPATPYSYFYPPMAYTGHSPKYGFYTASGAKYAEEINKLFGSEKAFVEGWLAQEKVTNLREHLRVWPRGVHVYQADSKEFKGGYYICAVRGQSSWLFEVWLNDPSDVAVVERIAKSIRFEY